MTVEGRVGTSLGVQWLRLYTSNAGGWVPSLVRELEPTCNLEFTCPNYRVHILQLKISHAATKMHCS